VRAADLGRILLVQAAEEADPAAERLPHEERARASRLARPDEPGPGPERFLTARADRLWTGLRARSPAFERALAAARMTPPPALVAAAAFLLGLGLDRLGPARRISLLAFPLLGLLCWNLAVYAALGLGPWLLGRRRPTARRWATARAVARGAFWLATPGRPWLRSEPPGERRWVVATLGRFLSLWLAAAGPLLEARTRMLLHLGAGAFALGAVASMYVRGLAFEYRASWESTFLDTEGVRQLLSLVLGPAAWVLAQLGEPLAPRLGGVFSSPALERLRGPAGDGEAAIWVHLWALTIFLGVLAPRSALAWLAARRARRLARDLPLSVESPYFQRLLAPARGAGALVQVFPYSYRPSGRVMARIDQLLPEIFGGQAAVEILDPVPYGADPPGVPPGPAAAAGSSRVVVFNLAQSPEREVHGRLLELCRQEVDRESGASLLILLDEEAYRLRLGPTDPRLTERRRAWERLAEECGLVALALVEAGDDDVLARAPEALWPPRPGRTA
jgi:hypothetical protein